MNLKSKLKRVNTEPQKHSYPSLSGEPEDDTTHSRNLALLQEEMDKLKPSNKNVKNLMTRTFLNWREWILNSEAAISQIIEVYPCLELVIYVSLDYWLYS